jgi:hypothetical protein
MSPLDMAARVRDLAAELTARAGREHSHGLTLSAALAELRSAIPAGNYGVSLDAKHYAFSESNLHIEWDIWDGDTTHSGKTLESAMAAWRVSRDVAPLADAERVVAPLLADDAVVPLFEGMPTIGEPVTTVLT